MVRYELLMLAVPEITKDETAELEKYLERSVKKAQAGLISFERWGKYRLAYPVRKNQYGVYFLARFEMEQAVADPFLKDIRSLLKLKLSNVVMRDLITKLLPGESLAYHRPESLEEAPAEDVNLFLRKNKMESIASSAVHARSDREELVEDIDFESESDEESEGKA